MAFPDDYRRVQFAGGIQTDVDVHVGLPGQVLVDKTNWNLRLLDGVTAGGHKVLMTKDLSASLQNAQLEGEALHIALGTDSGAGSADAKGRIWKASKLKAFFNKFLAITMNGDNTDYTIALLDSALRTSIRTTGLLISNLNDATTSGWYRFIQSSTLNMPGDMPNTGTNQAFVFVMTQAVNSLVQMIVARDGSSKIWIRGRIDGEWGDWALATGVTGADLATKVSKTGDTMTGKLGLSTATDLGHASLNIPDGVAFSPGPVDGDIWRIDAHGGLRFRRGATSRTILDSSHIALPADVTAGTAGKLLDAAVAKTQASVGIEQTWQLFTSPARVSATAYQNTTGRPIIWNLNGGDTTSMDVSPDGVTWVAITVTVASRYAALGSIVVPPGFYYRATGGTSIVKWAELR